MEKESATTLSDISINEYLSTNEGSNFHNKKSNKSITISTSKNEFSVITNHLISENPNLNDLQEIATNERHDRKLDTKMVLFISIGWTTTLALQLFMLCLEVVWCDVTPHSNNIGFSSHIIMSDSS